MFKRHAKLVKIRYHTCYVLKTDGLGLIEGRLIIIWHHVWDSNYYKLMKIHLDSMIQTLRIIFQLTFFIFQIESVRKRQQSKVIHLRLNFWWHLVFLEVFVKVIAVRCLINRCDKHSGRRCKARLFHYFVYAEESASIAGSMAAVARKGGGVLVNSIKMDSIFL